jgi:hypothetical protein
MRAVGAVVRQAHRAALVVQVVVALVEVLPQQHQLREQQTEAAGAAGSVKL